MSTFKQNTAFVINPADGSQDSQIRSINTKANPLLTGNPVVLAQTVFDVNPKNPYFLLFAGGTNGVFYYSAIPTVEQSPYIINTFRFLKSGSAISSISIVTGQIDNSSATAPENYYDPKMPTGVIYIGSTAQVMGSVNKLSNAVDSAYNSPASGLSLHQSGQVLKTGRWSTQCEQVELTQTMYANNLLWGGTVDWTGAPSSSLSYPIDIVGGLIQQSW